MPDLPCAPAYMARSSAVFNFWGNGCSKLVHPQPQAALQDVAPSISTECRTMMPSRAIQPEQQGPSASKTQWFSLDDDPTPVEEQSWGHEVDLSEDASDLSPSILSNLSCARRRKTKDLNNASMPWSRAMLKASLVLASRVLNFGEHGEPSAQGGQDGGDRVLGGGATPEEEDRSQEADGRLEKDGAHVVADDRNSSQPDGTRLHSQESSRERPHLGRVGVQEVPTSQCEETTKTDGLDQPRNRSPTWPIGGSEALASRSQQVQSSRRVSSVPSQPPLKVVGVSSMRRPMGEDREFSSFIVDNGGGAGTSSSSTLEGGQDRQELSGIPASTSLSTTTREHPAGKQLRWKDLDESCGPSPDTSDFKDHTANENQPKPFRDEEDNQWTSPGAAPQEERSPSGKPSDLCAVGRRVGGRADGLSEDADGKPGNTYVSRALLSLDQLGSTRMKNAFFSKGVMAKVFMVLCTASCTMSNSSMQSPTPDFTWLGSQPFGIGSAEEPIVSRHGHFAHGQLIVDEVDLVRQSAVDLEADDIRTLPRKVKRILATNFSKSNNKGKSQKDHQKNFRFEDGVPNHGDVDVMEIYSQPRVSARAKLHGLTPGGSLDLSTGWDFSKPSQQAKALRLVRELRPALVVLSPPCTAFSAMRRLSTFKRSPEVVAAELEQAKIHVRFSVQIARIQMSAGRGFLFEHPATASSWHTTELASLKRENNVYEVKVDMCAFGLVTKEGLPALKPTLLLTNIETLANALGRRCEGRHPQHQPLVGGRAAAAATYTQQFVDCILRALRKHLQCRPEGTPPEDYWTLTSTHLIRHHVQPRWTLFNPEHVTVKPCSVTQLGERRVSTKNSDPNHIQVLKDNWRTDRSHPTWSCPWTGTTEFEVADPFILPTASMNSAATWIAASGAHPLHHYVLEETEFQEEWHHIASAFPTHRILEGAGDSGNGGNGDFSASSASSSSRSTSGALRSSPLPGAGSTTSSTSSSSRPRSSASSLPPTTLDRPRRKPTPLPSISEVKGEDALEDELDAEVDRAGRELRGPAQQPDVGEVSLHPELRRELYRLHRNLGHPDKQTFMRALKNANCRKEAIEWVRSSFRCPLCERKQKPKSQRPGHLSQEMPFNKVVGIDLVFYEEHVLVNMLCWGTDLQIVTEVTDKRASVVCTAFMTQWVAHYGPPQLVVADQGKEFISEEFGGRLGEHGIAVHYTDVRSPWQNARTERAGGSFKTRLETIIHETTASEEEFPLVVAETCAAHNRYYNRAGFSPYQRAFGVNPRLPASLLSDDALDRDLLRSSAGDEVRRAWEIRDAAAQAWLRSQDSDAVKRSLKDHNSYCRPQGAQGWRHSVCLATYGKLQRLDRTRFCRSHQLQRTFLVD